MLNASTGIPQPVLKLIKSYQLQADQCEYSIAKTSNFFTIKLQWNFQEVDETKRRQKTEEYSARQTKTYSDIKSNTFVPRVQSDVVGEASCIKHAIMPSDFLGRSQNLNLKRAEDAIKSDNRNALESNISQHDSETFLNKSLLKLEHTQDDESTFSVSSLDSDEERQNLRAFDTPKAVNHTANNHVVLPNLFSWDECSDENKKPEDIVTNEPEQDKTSSTNNSFPNNASTICSRTHQAKLNRFAERLSPIEETSDCTIGTELNSTCEGEIVDKKAEEELCAKEEQKCLSVSYVYLKEKKLGENPNKQQCKTAFTDDTQSTQKHQVKEIAENRNKVCNQSNTFTFTFEKVTEDTLRYLYQLKKDAELTWVKPADGSIKNVLTLENKDEIKVTLPQMNMMEKKWRNVFKVSFNE